MMVNLETKRLRLRQFCEADLDEYARFSADSEVMHFVGGPLTREQAWRHMATVLGHWQLRGYGLWAVEEKQSGALLGRIGFLNPEGWPGFELGWLLRREAWGKGYATEAARSAMSYGFAELDQPHIISLIHARNTRSRRVAERLGERPEGEIELQGDSVLIYGIDRD